MTHDEIQRGLDAFKPSGNRMDIVKVKAATVINDSYNANPDAMKAALDMLWDMGKGSRRLAVLGDMLEMGEMSETGHLEIGAYAAEKADAVSYTHLDVYKRQPPMFATNSWRCSTPPKDFSVSAILTTSTPIK